MSVMTEDVHAAAPSVFYDPRVRKIVFQIVLAVVVVFLIVAAASNAVERLHQQNTAMGFEFLHRPAGFDISQTPIEFTSKGSTNLEAFVVGLLNTLIVGSIGVVVATILGFTIGIARLSPNWLISKIATVYVEFIRNIPLLLQLYFWYSAVLKPLPNPRQSVSVGDTVFLNNRGVYMPAIDLGGSGLAMLIGLLLGLAGAFGYARYGRRVQEATGRRPPVGLVSAGIIIGLPLLGFLVTGATASISMPQLQGFNFIGGFKVGPEFAALILGLSLYTASFIAEIVRGGILAVSHGQTEAARAIGLKGGQTLRLVVVPQAMRVIIPPLANQPRHFRLHELVQPARRPGGEVSR
jgi:general L-amino acid transport system permease protein